MIRGLLMIAALAAGGAALANGKVVSAPGAVLRGLDKVNGQTVDVEVGRGDTVRVFGLDVALGDCRYLQDNPTGDAFAYLTIWNHDARQAVFDAWMIASSPALSALEHARYDVWVIRCMTP